MADTAESVATATKDLAEAVVNTADQVVTGTRDMGQAAAGAAVRIATAAARPFFPGASPNNDDERNEGE